MKQRRVREDVQKFFDAAEQLGFSEPELQNSGHWAVRSDNGRGRKVTCPNSGSDWRGIRNAMSELENVSGRKLPRSNGYSGGSAQLRGSVARRHRQQWDKGFRVTSAGERVADEAFDRALDKAAEYDRHIEAAAQAGNVALLRELVAAREVLCDTAHARWHRPVPECPVEGLEVLLAVGTGDTDVAALRRRFND